AFEPPAREPGVGRVQGGATAVRFVNVLVQLQPEVVQRVGGVVGVAQGLRAGDRVRRGVQRGPDRVVGALLPVSRSRRARALSHLVRCREGEPPERPRVAHLRGEGRERGGGRGGGGALLQRDERKDESASTSPQGWEGLCLASCRYPPATPATTIVSPSQPGRDRC